MFVIVMPEAENCRPRGRLDSRPSVGGCLLENCSSNCSSNDLKAQGRQTCSGSKRAQGPHAPVPCAAPLAVLCACLQHACRAGHPGLYVHFPGPLQSFEIPCNWPWCAPTSQRCGAHLKWLRGVAPNTRRHAASTAAGHAQMLHPRPPPAHICGYGLPRCALEWTGCAAGCSCRMSRQQNPQRRTCHLAAMSLPDAPPLCRAMLTAQLS